jgi:hypothetical protein
MEIHQRLKDFKKSEISVFKNLNNINKNNLKTKYLNYYTLDKLNFKDDKDNSNKK